MTFEAGWVGLKDLQRFLLTPNILWGPFQPKPFHESLQSPEWSTTWMLQPVPRAELCVSIRLGRRANIRLQDNLCSLQLSCPQHLDSSTFTSSPFWALGEGLRVTTQLMLELCPLQKGAQRCFGHWHSVCLWVCSLAGGCWLCAAAFADVQFTARLPGREGAAWVTLSEQRSALIHQDSLQPPPPPPLHVAFSPTLHQSLLVYRAQVGSLLLR